jgi:probable rRNA maturation factor
MNKIEIFNETTYEVDEIKDIKIVIDKAVQTLKLDSLEFNIILVDNTYIHKLNKDYRGIDRPTDVISFALEDYEDNIDLDHRILGDIYISIDKAHSQAEEYGHSFKREICFLAVHGLLHLLGYDHMKEEDEKIMFGLQEVILNEANIKK